MHRSIYVLGAAVAVAVSLTLAPATAVLDSNMELVARIPYADGSHLEFTTRTAPDGSVRTFAVTGSRDIMDPATTHDSGIRIIEITDPENPEVIWFLHCPQSANDVQISHDGMILAVAVDFGPDTGPTGQGCTLPSARPGFQAKMLDVSFIDLTDIDNPVPIGSLVNTPEHPVPRFVGVHTAAWHPNRNIIYLSNNEIIDVAPTLGIIDFDAPGYPTAREVPLPGISGPHDGTFTADGTRFDLGLGTVTFIFDTTDPLAPVLLTKLADATIQVHHEAWRTPNGRYLLIADEWAGASGNPQCPGGGVHVYDLGHDRSLEAAPIPVGVFFAPTGDVSADWRNSELEGFPYEFPNIFTLPVCSAHEGNMSPDGNRLSLAWFRGGVRMFDTSVLMQDLPIGTPVGSLVLQSGFAVEEGGQAWATKFAPGIDGYVFSSDMWNGFEVYRLSGPAAG